MIIAIENISRGPVCLVLTRKRVNQTHPRIVTDPASGEKAVSLQRMSIGDSLRLRKGERLGRRDLTDRKINPDSLAHEPDVIKAVAARRIKLIEQEGQNG